MKLAVKLHRHNILVLVVAAFLAIIAVFKLQGLPSLQFSIFSGLIAFYLFWAIFYHHFDKSLKLEVVLEYILTALLALIILYGVLL